MMHVLGVGCLLIGLATTSKPPIRLTPLPSADGCGCTFSVLSAPDQTILSRDLDEDGAVIGVNGKAIRLTRSSFGEVHKVQGHITLGDKFNEVLKGDDVTVALEYKATFVCADDDEGCEVTEYLGTLRVSLGKSRQAFKVAGACGC